MIEVTLIDRLEVKVIKEDDWDIKNRYFGV